VHLRMVGDYRASGGCCPSGNLYAAVNHLRKQSYNIVDQLVKVDRRFLPGPLPRNDQEILDKVNRTACRIADAGGPTEHLAGVQFGLSNPAPLSGTHFR